MAKPKAYTVRKADPELLALAVEAYRLAVQYRRRNILKWDPRDEELRKADEFSRVRCAWENSDYMGERLEDITKHCLLAIISANRELPKLLLKFDADLFKKSKNRDFVRALNAFQKMLDNFKPTPKDAGHS